MSASAMPEFAPTVDNGGVRISDIARWYTPTRPDAHKPFTIPVNVKGTGLTQLSYIGPFATREAAYQFVDAHLAAVDLLAPIGAVA